MAASMARLETEYDDPLAALDYLALSIHNFHDSANTALMGVPMASLATIMDRLGHHESAATIVGFALSPLTTATFPELEMTIAHLRSVLGDQTYESLARKGETMTTATMATYAYDQIDQARTELEAVSNSKDIATRLFVSPRTVQTYLTLTGNKTALMLHCTEDGAEDGSMGGPPATSNRASAPLRTGGRVATEIDPCACA